MGWRTVVRAGRAWRAAMMSSQPVTATSSGTRRPRSSAASRVARARSSLPQTIASGRSGEASRAVAAARAEASPEAQGTGCGGREAVAVEHGADPGPALGDVEGVVGVAQEGEPAVAVAEQVLGQPLGAGEVLGGDGVGAVDVAPGQQDDREPAGHDRADRVLADGGVEDGQAVDPGGELADGRLGVGLLAGGQDQHAAAQPGGDLLVAEHDLGEVGAGQVGEDDPVGGVAALGQGDAEAAGDEAQLVDRVLDPLAGLVLHRGRAAQDPGDGGDRHPGPAGDVVDGDGHREALSADGGCKRFQRARPGPAANHRIGADVSGWGGPGSRGPPGRRRSRRGGWRCGSPG